MLTGRVVWGRGPNEIDEAGTLVCTEVGTLALVGTWSLRVGIVRLVSGFDLTGVRHDELSAEEWVADTVFLRLLEGRGARTIFAVGRDFALVFLGGGSA